MKRAVLISCFDWYKGRLEIVRNYLLEKGYEVEVLLSDFNHIRKIKHIHKHSKCKYIHVIPYKKNISMTRIISHLMFGQSVKKYIKKYDPEFIYAVAPPNNVVNICKKYKENNKKTKLVIDIIDLWPESMPLGGIKKNLLFKIWSSWRNEGILAADHVFTECNYYQHKLSHVINKRKTSTLYLNKFVSKKENDYIENLIDKRNCDDVIRFAYLGSMNNILDIDGICNVVKNFIENEYNTEFHAVGDGENRALFEDRMKATGCATFFYGSIFDNEEKIKIITPCNYAFNMMKENIEVGLTIKSMDYFSMGVPVINNIKGDTWELVEKEKVGVNVKENYFEDLKYIKSGREIKEFFERSFSMEALAKNIEEGLSEVAV